MCQCQFPRFPRARAPRRSIPGGAERGSAPRVPPAPCPRAKIERALAACMKNSRSVRRGILLSPQPARVRLITEFNCRSGNKYDLIRYKPTQTNVIFFALAAALGFHPSLFFVSEHVPLPPSKSATEGWCSKPIDFL